MLPIAMCTNCVHVQRVLRIRSTGGSVVECSPATRAARVRFPASAFFAAFSGFIFYFLIDKSIVMLLSSLCFICIFTLDDSCQSYLHLMQLRDISIICIFYIVKYSCDR